MDNFKGLQTQPQQINQKLDIEEIEQSDDFLDFKLSRHQLNCQDTLQYLLSILNFLLDHNHNHDQMIEFYANPNIKIKCYPKEPQLINKFHRLDLLKFHLLIDQFISYLQELIVFDNQAVLIIQILKEYDQIEFQSSLRELYQKLIQYIDLKQYLKQELLYDIKDYPSPFIYKLNKCNYTICFNDNILYDPNGPGFLPVLQKINGYKGFGNLFMINIGSEEWENVKLYNCQYEMLLIFKKLSKASYHLYKQQMQFRNISKHQIVKFNNSYRILFHNLENSSFKCYIDHYKHFICLYEQLLQDNQLDHFIAQAIKDKFYSVFYTKNLGYQKNLACGKKQNESKMSCRDNTLDDVAIRYQETKTIEQIHQELNYFEISNFSLKELNDRGSQSNIYFCTNKLTRRQFALAQPKQNYDYSELQLNIQKIKSILPKIERKSIVKIYKIEQNQMWMEYSNTGNLFEYFDKRKLELFEILIISQQICQILLNFHNKSFYHLDVKLENFLIFKKYGLYRIKVCDFGSMTDQQQFTFNMTKHRLLYSPPEAKENGLINSEKFDIWQLGQLFSKMKLDSEYPFLFNWLKHHNPQLRKSIREVLDQIGIYIENLMHNYIEYNLAWKCQVYYNEIEEELEDDFVIAQQQFFEQVNYKTTYKRKDDEQIFKITQFNQKNNWGFLFNKYFQIYDMESSNNNWTQFCLFRKTSNIQNLINKQYWSLNQKSLYLNILLKDLFSINYFQQYDPSCNQLQRKIPNPEEKVVGQQFQDQNMRKLFFKEAQNQAIFLSQKLHQDNSEQENKEEKFFIIKIIIFQSLIIDILSNASKQIRFFLELKEIANKIIFRKVQVINKNSYLGNIQSHLLNILDFSQQLQFKFMRKKIIRLMGFLYLVDDNVKKYYLRMTLEVANLGLDHVYLELSQLNFPYQSIINFKRFNVENFELFKLDFENNLCPYMKFVSQQMIQNYKGKYMIDSPFNLIEGVFIDKRSNCFIKNDMYFIDKNLDEQVNLIRYFILVIQQQLIMIGSYTFNQKLVDRLRQLHNESKNDQLDQQNQINLIKSLLTMYDMRNTRKLQQQLELLYFIENLWNFDLVNLLIECNNLKENKNHFQEYAAKIQQDYITINQKSNFEYYISVENALNASKIYQGYISSQLIPVIIYQQKQSKIIQSNKKRILIDSFRSVSFASKGSKLKNKNVTQTKQIQEIFQFYVYLETSSIKINQICEKMKLFSSFEWISLIQCLLSKYDKTGYYYYYLKRSFGRYLVAKLLVLIKCSDVLELSKNSEIENMILYFKEKDEQKYLQTISDMFGIIYHQNVYTISRNMLQMEMQILNIKYNNFYFVSQLFQEQFTEKQYNLIVYLSYFLFVNEIYEKDIYYDLSEERIYLDLKENSFHLKYHLLFKDGQLNKDLQYQLISSFLKNFSSYRLQSKQNQLNFIMNSYNVKENLEQQGFQIIKKLGYVNPSIIYIIKHKQSNDQYQYLCCYHLNQFYLNYDNFKVIQNQQTFEYHCQTMVKLNGQLIRIQQINVSNIYILLQIIRDLVKLASLIFFQGFQFDIKEENLVLVLLQEQVIIYPVQIKKAQDSFEDIKLHIKQFEKEARESILKAELQLNEKFIQKTIKDQVSEISTDESYYLS